MLCEVCGKKAPNPLVAEIEGAELTVCSDCASLGKVLRSAIREKKQFAPNIEQRAAFTPKPFKAPEIQPAELIEDYGNAVKNAREKLGWTREELAKKVFEKESVLQRVEAGQLEPDHSLLKKLEKTLNISLKE